MTERASKSKFNEDGSPKTYFAHNGPDGLCFGESSRNAQSNGRSWTPKAPAAPKSEVDWEAISRGKVRHGVAVAFIEKLGAVALEPKHTKDMETWVDWIISGQAYDF